MKNNNQSENIIYLHSDNNKYRYALGTKGENTLYCIGINPSTATPNKDDQTIRIVRKIAFKEGYDSYIMLNIYPQRATNPKNMDKKINQEEHEQNLHTFDIIKDNSTIWAAWGNNINKKPYLNDCLYHIKNKLNLRSNIRWVKMGNLTNQGNPRQVLFQMYKPLSNYN